MKNGKFVGKFTRKMTTEEIEQFISILESAFHDTKVKIKSIDVKGDQSAVGYYGYASTLFTVTLSKKISFHKGTDTVYNVNNLRFYVQPQEGFDNYENCQKYQREVGEKGYGRDDFNSFEWSVNINTDGRVHEYRRHHKNDYLYEGEGHYLYYTELNEFFPDIKNYLSKNIPANLTWE